HAAPRPGHDCCAPLAQLVTRDREQPGLRRLWSGLETGQRGKGSGEGLGCKIKSFLWAAHSTAKETKHRSEVPLVENAERLRTRARREQKLGVGGLPAVLHASYMTIPHDL